MLLILTLAEDKALHTLVDGMLLQVSPAALGQAKPRLCRLKTKSKRSKVKPYIFNPNGHNDCFSGVNPRHARYRGPACSSLRPGEGTLTSSMKLLLVKASRWSHTYTSWGGTPESWLLKTVFDVNVHMHL
eukprot:1029452-Amphidinium_carterae.1